MIERLKYMIDEAEDKPRIKDLLLKVAALREDTQEKTLELIEMMLENGE